MNNLIDIYHNLNFDLVIPSLVLIIGALVILILDLIKPKLPKILYLVLALITFAISAHFLYHMNVTSMKGFYGLIRETGISKIFFMLMIITSALFLPIQLRRKKSNEDLFNAEYFGLYLLMISLFSFVIISTNLIVILLSIEAGSFILYTLIAMYNTNRSVESAIKYYTLGSVATGFFAFAIAIFYYLTGSVDYYSVLQSLTSARFNGLLVILAYLFLLVLIAFKLGLLPFHSWMPDVYEGANPPMTAFMSVVIKVPVIFILLNFFVLFVHFLNINIIKQILYIIIVLSMLYANFAALVTKDVKRMLAYSSIVHSTFLLTLVFTGKLSSFFVAGKYIFILAITNYAILAIIALLNSKDEKTPYSKFDGLIYSNPYYSVVLIISVLSLIGVPPFGLFFAKVSVLMALFSSNLSFLAIIVLISSVISVYYYVRVLVHVFKKDELAIKQITVENSNIYIKIYLAFLTILIVFLAFYLQYINEFIAHLLH